MIYFPFKQILSDNVTSELSFVGLGEVTAATICMLCEDDTVVQVPSALWAEVRQFLYFHVLSTNMQNHYYILQLQLNTTYHVYVVQFYVLVICKTLFQI